MKSLELTIQGMHCDGCAATLEALLGREPGVKAASVSFPARKGRILYDPGAASPATLAAAVRQAGYRVATDPSSAAE
jgi:copper chaperone CopZ